MSSEGGDSMTNTVYSLLGMSSLDITWYVKVSLHAWQVREMISCNKSNVNCVHATSTRGIFQWYAVGREGLVPYWGKQGISGPPHLVRGTCRQKTSWNKKL